MHREVKEMLTQLLLDINNQENEFARVRQTSNPSMHGLPVAHWTSLSTTMPNTTVLWRPFSMLIRAVYLELVPDLSTQAFMHAFKERRGIPKKMTSDNAQRHLKTAEKPY